MKTNYHSTRTGFSIRQSACQGVELIIFLLERIVELLISPSPLSSPPKLASPLLPRETRGAVSQTSKPEPRAIQRSDVIISAECLESNPNVDVIERCALEPRLVVGKCVEAYLDPDVVNVGVDVYLRKCVDPTCGFDVPPATEQRFRVVALGISFANAKISEGVKTSIERICIQRCALSRHLSGVACKIGS